MNVVTTIRNHIFYGNYFYGLCAVALSVEASLQQHFRLNSIVYYLLIFSSTVYYYTRAYLPKGHGMAFNPRDEWYLLRESMVLYSQRLFLVVVSVFILAVLWKYYSLGHVPALSNMLLAIIFPLAGLLYYGLRGGRSLRSVGWLKPFVIGFVWAGIVTVYPILDIHFQEGTIYSPSLLGSLLFLKNFMFVTVLCIMFDIKDYAADSQLRLHTFVVQLGLRKTIFYLIIPLCLLGFGTFIAYGATHHFSYARLLLNTLPFVLLVAVAYSLYRRRQVIFYLVIVDGLMLVKATCGAIAALYF